MRKITGIFACFFLAVTGAAGTNALADTTSKSAPDRCGPVLAGLENIPRSIFCGSNETFGSDGAFDHFRLTCLSSEEPQASLPNQHFLARSNDDVSLAINFSNQSDNLYEISLPLSGLEAIRAGTSDQVEGVLRFSEIECPPHTVKIYCQSRFP